MHMLVHSSTDRAKLFRILHFRAHLLKIVIWKFIRRINFHSCSLTVSFVVLTVTD